MRSPMEGNTDRFQVVCVLFGISQLCRQHRLSPALAVPSREVIIKKDGAAAAKNADSGGGLKPVGNNMLLILLVLFLRQQ